MICKACRTTNCSKHGAYRNKKGLYQRWKCNNCGITWSEDKSIIEAKQRTEK